MMSLISEPLEMKVGNLDLTKKNCVFMSCLQNWAHHCVDSPHTKGSYRHFQISEPEKRYSTLISIIPSFKFFDFENIYSSHFCPYITLRWYQNILMIMPLALSTLMIAPKRVSIWYVKINTLSLNRTELNWVWLSDKFYWTKSCTQFYAVWSQVMSQYLKSKSINCLAQSKSHCVSILTFDFPSSMCYNLLLFKQWLNFEIGIFDIRCYSHTQSVSSAYEYSMIRICYKKANQKTTEVTTSIPFQ